MSKIITGFFYDIGGREIYEDRVDAKTITTAGGRTLVVGVVADGVGGANRGERAAQLAKDAVLDSLSRRPERDVSALLAAAVQDANQAVFGEFRTTQGASTTLVVAAIDENNTLYIANVGDSRVYLSRKDKLTQLTLDHTFANVMPWQGKMSAELARENPRADVLMMALGPKAQTLVDTGFYVGTTDYNTAAERGRQGLPMKEGDSVLVCSDGLIKESSKTGLPFTNPEEIIRVLTTQEGEKAARSLVSFALGRDPEDNISVAVLQMPDPARHRRAQRPLMLAGVAIGALALLLVIALLAINRTQAGAQATQTAVALAQETAAFIANETAAAQESTIGQLANQATATAQSAQETAIAIASIPPTETPTPIPTATPPPTPIPGQVGVFFARSGSTPFTLNDPIPVANELLEFQMDSSGGQVPASSIYAAPNSQIEFAAVDATGRRISFRLSPGSDVFVETGGYINEAFTLGTFQGIMQSDPGSCMSLTYPQPDASRPIILSCHHGTCSYRIGSGTRVELAAGRQIVFDTADSEGREMVIPDSHEIAIRTMISPASDGRRDANTCGLASRPTPTPTFTPTQPPRPTITRTPTLEAGQPPAQPSRITATVPGKPTNTTAPTRLSTNTPTRPPTNTPPNPPTNTPTRPPTNTPTRPPTNTPTRPPTNTPTRPPTATPSSIPTPTNTLQPTNTPQPTATDTPEPTVTPIESPSPSNTKTAKAETKTANP